MPNSYAYEQRRDGDDERAPDDRNHVHGIDRLCLYQFDRLGRDERDEQRGERDVLASAGPRAASTTTTSSHRQPG